MTNNQFIVMIVDDDESIRRAARRLIKSYGFPVETFASAEDFLSSGRLHETACLVLDVQMPGLNGLELQSRLITDGHQVPIIFITAFNDENARAQALKAGALGYLVKPFEEADLLTAINVALRRQEIGRQSPGTLH
ncbi:MAG TPA: response regulator [Stellaceae bacterium]|jgi:FixJ family two-component response regulator|nr:response regulator [Stellaceae bacterium]